MKWAGPLQPSTILFAARDLRTRARLGRPLQPRSQDSDQPAILQLSSPAVLPGAALALSEMQGSRVFKNLEIGVSLPVL